MTRVLLAKDVRVLRDALVGVLSLADDIDVVGAVETGDAIVPTALHARPDVAVLDIELPRLDGISAAAQPVCGTVRKYLAAAVTKLGARNRVDAIRMGSEAGWL